MAIYLSQDLTDDNKNKALQRNIKVELNVTKNLPFISRSQLFGYKEKTTTPNTEPNTIEYNTALKSKYRSVPTLSDFINGLVEIKSTTDNDGNVTNTITDRFVPITIIPSMVTIPEMQLYFDKMTSNYIIIPTQYDVSDNDSETDVLSSGTIQLEAYRVGTYSGLEDIKTIQELFAKDVTTSQSIGKLTDCKIHFLQDIGDDGYKKGQNIGDTIGNDYLELTGMRTVFIVSLGSDSHLGVKLPLYKSIQNGFGTRTYKYVGEASVNDIAILLPL